MTDSNTPGFGVINLMTDFLIEGCYRLLVIAKMKSSSLLNKEVPLLAIHGHLRGLAVARDENI